MTYDNWKAEEPMAKDDGGRAHDEDDYRIAVAALGDILEAVTTFKYASGLDDVSLSSVKFILNRLLAQVETTEVGSLDATELQAFRDSIAEL